MRFGIRVKSLPGEKVKSMRSMLQESHSASLNEMEDAGGGDRKKGRYNRTKKKNEKPYTFCFVKKVLARSPVSGETTSAEHRGAVPTASYGFLSGFHIPWHAMVWLATEAR